MEKLLKRMRKICTSNCFRDGVKALAIDNGININEIALPFHEVENRLKSPLAVSNVTLDTFGIIITVTMTRSFFGHDDRCYTSTIQECYEKLVKLEIITCAQMHFYHTLMFQLSRVPQVKEPALVD